MSAKKATKKKSVKEIKQVKLTVWQRLYLFFSEIWLFIQDKFK